MKAVFITYIEAHHEAVLDILDKCNQRGYTNWIQTRGVGSDNGEPHLGDHAWPSMNTSTIVFTDDVKAAEIKKRLEALDARLPAQGLKVITWTID